MDNKTITQKELSRLIDLKEYIENEETKELITKAIRTINAAIIIINDSKNDKDKEIRKYENKLKEKQKELDILEKKVKNEIERNIELYQENMKLKGLE